MSKIDQINKAKSLLSSALSAAINSMPNNKSVQDAKMHMKKALIELDNAANAQIQKKTGQTPASNWNKNINDGIAIIANQPMSKEATQRSLKQINSMIETEHKNIEEMNKLSANGDEDILND